jgi:hypothetical protein
MANERPKPEGEDEAEAIIEDVLRAFEELLPKGALDENRDLLLDVIAAHPLGRVLAERVRDRGPVDQSKEQYTQSGAIAAGVPATGGSGLRRKGKANGER